MSIYLTFHLNTIVIALQQVLKKNCDHPCLLTKKAAGEVLKGMDTMATPDELGMIEKMVLELANTTESEDFQILGAHISCKITFILSLLVGCCPTFSHQLCIPHSLIPIMYNFRIS